MDIESHHSVRECKGSASSVLQIPKVDLATAIHQRLRVPVPLFPIAVGPSTLETCLRLGVRQGIDRVQDCSSGADSIARYRSRIRSIPAIVVRAFRLRYVDRSL